MYAPRFVRVSSASNSFAPLKKASSVLASSKISNVPSTRSSSTSQDPFKPLDSFVRRHIGPREEQIKKMLGTLGYPSLDHMTNENVPKNIQMNRSLKVGPERGESEILEELKAISKKNKIFKTYIGTGYYGTKTPAVIQRNILENPGWYTPYTPYQAEISQGRLQSLLNFQTMVTDLTKMDYANASLLDEATAAGEAMYMSYQIKKKKRKTYFVDKNCHPQTIALVDTRAEILDINVVVDDFSKVDLTNADLFGVLIQYPQTNGRVVDYSQFVKDAHNSGIIVSVATDLLACTVLQPPGEFGADIALGSAQRLGVPMGYGGPHAAFFAVKDEYKRLMPGRLIGVSKDTNGDPALRMALQTREQHIRRETATSNICTAQALLANIAANYAVYHGADGLTQIAQRIHRDTTILAAGLEKMGYTIGNGPYFDTLTISHPQKSAKDLVDALLKKEINIRKLNDKEVTVSLDETVTEKDLQALFDGFSLGNKVSPRDFLGAENNLGNFKRTSKFLEHPVFNKYHSETEMMRFLKNLENKDFSLLNGMIPLGSCTMKLNAAVEMYPVTWPEFGQLHPFVPLNQAEGYADMLRTLSKNLCDVTGFAAISLQPNSGSQGEYAGLRVIRDYLVHTGQSNRNICVIPESAHGTNPASAALANMKIVVVKSNRHGNVDMEDLKAKVEANAKDLACIMITYPSTHGVFEEGIKEICEIVHKAGGQVYMDGANMNSQVGLCSPGEIGADVCHLNLHKTFCIPHGGGGPGMGPIGVAKHLAPFLPGHPVVDMGEFGGSGKPVSAAPFGSSSILPISHVYIQLMGSSGLKKATQLAILNANYMANRLKGHYEIVYKKENGLVAHEFILDMRPFRSIGIGVEDVAKRLIDYGFHAPTMAWPIHDTLMIEPTESEPLEEMDRLCDALISIREEIRLVENGKIDPKNNMLVRAPHTQKDVLSDKWERPYTREQAAFPTGFGGKLNKYWPTVGRIDGVAGDRNLVCSCPPIETYM
eukprot:TRINITY_DN2146_c0_g1_i1.p1 TRINITY_DN2146_c0_g1~~TRINITY_DN2146_c0_g1_i1.p1  ORF type:complete len:996 (-),score=316.87 TRINITY_DN2146_c0_g1_i1:41-3028(-)